VPRLPGQPLSVARFGLALARNGIGDTLACHASRGCGQSNRLACSPSGREIVISAIDSAMMQTATAARLLFPIQIS